MQPELDYDYETDLDAPPGIPLLSVFVRIEVQPKDAEYVIYGWNHAGNLQAIPRTGSDPNLELPFINPHIFVKYHANLHSFELSTLGFRESRGQGFSPPEVRKKMQ